MMQTQTFFNKTFILLFSSNLLIFIGFEMLVPIFPAYLASLQATPLQMGAITTVFSIGAIIIRPFVGHYLMGRERKNIAIIATVALLGLTLSYSFFPVVIYLIMLRLFHGVAWGVSTTTMGAMVIDSIPKPRLGEGIGYFSISTTVGAILAPSLGILLFSYYSFQVAIFVSVLLTAVAVILIQRTASVAQPNVKKQEFSFIRALFLKEAWFPAVLTILTTCSFGAVITFLVLLGDERNLSAMYIFFLVNALVSTIIRPFTGKWYDNKGPVSLLVLASLLGFISFMLLVNMSTYYQLVLSAILFGASYGTMMACLQAWLIQSVTEEKSSVANAMFLSSFDFGLGFSALLLGIVAKWVSLTTIFHMVSYSFLLVALLVLIHASKERKRV